MEIMDKRDSFLQYLADIFNQNITISCLPDTIYGEFTLYNFDDNTRIEPISLVGVQAKLSNKYRNNKKINTFIKGNYLLIENRINETDIRFYDKLKMGYKIYINSDSSNIYNLTESLVNYLIHEKIVMQCKISNTMRNDALICRVIDYDSVIKINNFLGGTKYNYSLKNNPFMFNMDSVSIVKDNYFNYNYCLAKLLSKYYLEKKEIKDYNIISSNNFKDFLIAQSNILKGDDRKNLVIYYNLSNKNYYNEFINIIDYVVNVLSGNNSIESLRNISSKNIISTSNKCYFTKEYEDKVKFIINFMEQKYGIEDMHMRVLCFIKTGNYNLFTREGNINEKGEFISVRSVLKDNFNKDEFKKIISDMGWNAFVKVSKSTYEKYGEEQLKSAIDNLYNRGTISSFTNDNNLRSYLGLIIPCSLLKEVIDSKCRCNNLDNSINSIYNIIYNLFN